MKRNTIILLLLSAISFISCDKLFLNVEGTEASIQGKWQLTSIRNNNSTSVVDTVYYNFQKNLFEYQVFIEKDSILSVNGYYTLFGDTAIKLQLASSYIYVNGIYSPDRSLDFIGWDTMAIHAPGVDTLFRYFKIKEVSGKKLNLSYQSEEYFFEKF